MAAVFDSNIIIDYFNGVLDSQTIIYSYKYRYISFITWIEALIKIPPERQDIAIEFLNEFNVVHSDEKLLREALKIRQTTSLKLPDAIILATSKIKKAKLITRNSKDFARFENVIVPY